MKESTREIILKLADELTEYCPDYSGYGPTRNKYTMRIRHRKDAESVNMLVVQYGDWDGVLKHCGLKSPVSGVSRLASKSKRLKRRFDYIDTHPTALGRADDVVTEGIRAKAVEILLRKYNVQSGTYEIVGYQEAYQLI